MSVRARVSVQKGDKEQDVKEEAAFAQAGVTYILAKKITVEKST